MRRKIRFLPQFLVFLAVSWLALGTPAWAMHIMEGFLPLPWALIWMAATLPFFLFGLRSIKKTVANNPELKLLLGLAAAFAFVLSALKMPSVTGSSSHPTGVALGALLFGPWPMTVIGLIVLLFQALLLAHGGLTTLGANTFSMAVAGPLVATIIFRLVRRIRVGRDIAVFLAAALADLATYVITALQLALAFPSSQGGVAASMVKFLGVFALTQVPLALAEGVLTVLVFRALLAHGGEELQQLPHVIFGDKKSREVKG